jgi:hypothetical protein
MYKAPPFAAHYNAKKRENVDFSVIVKGLSKNVNDSSFARLKIAKRKLKESAVSANSHLMNCEF